MFSNHSRLIFVVSLSLIIILLGYLIWDILNPQALIIDEHVNGSDVYFSSQQDAVLLATGCVDIEWQLENIDSVFLNGTGVVGSGQENFCFQVNRPSLRVVFRDNTEQVFTLPIRTFSNDPITFLILFLSALLLMIVAVTSPSQKLKDITQSLIMRLRQHLSTKELSLEDLLLARVAGYIFSLLNLSFVVAIAFNFSPTIPTFIFLVFACAGMLLGLWTSFHRQLGSFIQLRWVILLPFIWFIVTTSLHMTTRIELKTFATMTSWETTIFFWLLVYWGIAYIRRSFDFTKSRKMAWLSIFILFVIVATVSLTNPISENKPIHDRCSTLSPNQLWYYYCSIAPDSSEYVKYTQNFPESLKYLSTIIHRPVFSLLSSQICTLVDIPLYGYSAPYQGCSSYDAAVVAIWLTNFAFGLISIYIVYELVWLFSKDQYVAWLAGIFAALSPFHIWYFARPTTDYSEIFLASMGLWLAYKLFENPLPISRGITYGFVFGLMLLVKLNPIVFIFLIFMVLISRRWRLIPIFTILPFGLVFAYTQLIPLWGIRYMTVETGSYWSTVHWLWREWIYMSPTEMWHHMVIWFGHSAFQVAVLYGALLLIAIFTLLHNIEYAKKWIFLSWLLFLSNTIFAFVARLSYPGHSLDLMTGVYGATALGVKQMQDYLAAKVEGDILSSVVKLLILAVPIIQLLFLWFAFGGHNNSIIYTPGVR